MFENATVRAGVDGEVIVSMNAPGLMNAAFTGYSQLNGRTKLSAWINGGGSAGGGNSSMYDNCDAPLQVAAAAKTNYSIFKGEL